MTQPDTPADVETRSQARPRARARRRRAARAGLGGLDRARAPQEMVHAGAVDHLGLRDRSAPGRHLPHRHALARGQGVSRTSAASWRSSPTERLVWTDALLPGYRPAAGIRSSPRSSRWSRTAGNDATPRPPSIGRGRTQEARGDGLPRRAGARRSISSSRTSRRCERRDGTYLISCGSPPRDCCVSLPAPKTWSDD